MDRKMDDIDQTAIKNMISQALEGCNDADLLDFIYKLIINDTSKK